MSRFTKLDAEGKDLPADAKEFAAIRDTKTGLVWAAKAVLADDHAEAVKLAAEQTLFGEACRLPEADELLTLVDYKRYRPAADHQFFGHLPLDDWYWTNTPFAGDSGYAWFVYLDNGYSNYGGRGYGGYALAVRGAPSQ